MSKKVKSSKSASVKAKPAKATVAKKNVKSVVAKSAQSKARIAASPKSAKGDAGKSAKPKVLEVLAKKIASSFLPKKNLKDAAEKNVAAKTLPATKKTSVKEAVKSKEVTAVLKTKTVKPAVKAGRAVEAKPVEQKPAKKDVAVAIEKNLETKSSKKKGDLKQVPATVGHMSSGGASAFVYEPIRLGPDATPTQQKWAQLFNKSKKLAPVDYKMSQKYEAETPILHKLLGWGFILSNQNDRLEVLFQDGVKVLISNYNP